MTVVTGTVTACAATSWCEADIAGPTARCGKMRLMTSAGRREWWNFLRGFLRGPRTVGSVAPSSSYLVRAMLETADVEHRQMLAEFGPGTGVFTTEIVRRMHPDA